MFDQSSYNPSLDQPALSICANDRAATRSQIELALQNEANCAVTWLIHAWTCDSFQEAEISLQRALEMDPENGTAIAGLNWLTGIRELAEGQLEAKQNAAAILEQEEEAKARARAEEEARLRAEAREQARERAEEARLKAEQAKRLAEEAEAQARKFAEEETQYDSPEDSLPGFCAYPQTPTSQITPTENQPITQSEPAIESRQQPEIETLFESTINNDVDSLAKEVRLQVQSAVEIEPTPEACDQLPQPPSTERKTLVLAVDDSPTIRKLVSLTLSSEGFEVITACDGIEALSILANQIPDLILSDINMPKLGGYKFCKFVKKHERTSSIPVVMLSGKDGVFDKMRGKLNGCDDFLGKPFDSAELLAKVRENLAAVRN